MFAEYFSRLVLSIGLTVPAAMYLWRSGPEEVEHGLGPQRPLVKAREAAGEETQADRDPVRLDIFAHSVPPFFFFLF